MKEIKLILKYHNLKMLLTIDMNKLTEILIDYYGRNIIINFIEMDKEEKKKSSQIENFVLLVRERFWLFEADESNEIVRRNDLEIRIIDEGRK
jgi:hypothetical protein